MIRRYARTHGPFTTADIAARYAVAAAGRSKRCCAICIRRGNCWKASSAPAASHREWCDPEVLQQIRRKSLARLRREVEPVEQSTFVRFSTRWQGVTVPRRGLDALLDTIETLQGAALLASELEREILPARIADYHPGDLDALMAAGEVVWVGVEQVGDRDGRIALYLTESLPLLRLPDAPPSASKPTRRISQRRARRKNCSNSSPGRAHPSFPKFTHACGGGFPGETIDACGNWSGPAESPTTRFSRCANCCAPTIASARHRNRSIDQRPGSPGYLRRLRSRTSTGQAQGRWSLLRQRISRGSDNHAVERQHRATASCSATAS